MRLILQKDVKNLGKTGDQVSVKKGYARNFLIPKGLALSINKSRLKEWKHRQALIEAKKKKAILERQKTVERLSSVKLKFEKECQKDGKLFGSVTAHEISQALETVHKLSVDKRDISLSSPLKMIGEHTVEIGLDSENKTNISVQIEGKVIKKATEEDTENQTEDQTEEEAEEQQTGKEQAGKQKTEKVAVGGEEPQGKETQEKTQEKKQKEKVVGKEKTEKAAPSL